jgi:hypothetical protein|tara:strand:+ start:20784 stop:21254 length:471 start_codon:yes stop_codon:yes gene_type:complete
MAWKDLIFDNKNDNEKSINTSMTNEYKYDEIDFGFTAVDADDLSKLTSAPTEVREQLDASATEIQSLSRKVTELVELQTDIMSELVNAKQLYKEKSSHSDITVEQTEDKLMHVEKLIMPLLQNLLKNGEKDYIFWPNREPIIKGQMEKILEITRNE